VNFCSKKSWKLFSFQKRVGFLANQIYFYLFSIYQVIITYLFSLSEKVVRMRAHKAYLCQIKKQTEKNAMVSRNKKQ